MKRFLGVLYALVFACVVTVSAQTGVVTGKVLSAADSLAVIGATVMVEGGMPNTMVDVDGSFRLQGVKRGTADIEINFLGFITLNRKITVDEAVTDMGTLYLHESGLSIDEVVVLGQAPMAVQLGDTTQFNAAAFKTNPDADADELLMKMPGIIIQEGKIEAQGEPIRRIYVDGKLFFGTDPMAALKSLPADAVESIQLFDDLSDQAKFSGFDDGETQKAINIITKTKTSETTILRAELSGGADEDPGKFRYLTGGNFSHFTEKQRFTLTGLYNNVNTMKFGQNEVDESPVDDNGNIRNQPSGLQKISGVGANYSFENEKVKLSADYFWDHNKNFTERWTTTSYFPTHNYNSREQFFHSIMNSHTYSHRANVRLEWKLNKNNTIIFTPKINFRSQDTESSDSTYVQRDDHPQSRNSRVVPTSQDNYSISGNLLWTHRFAKRGRTISSNLSYTGTNRDYDRFLIYDYYENYKVNQSQWVDAGAYDQYTVQSTTGNLVRLKVTFSEPLGERHRLLLNAIGSRDWGSDDKQVDKYDSDGNWVEKVTRQSSDFTRVYNSYGGGVGYSYRDENLRYNVGVDYMRLDQSRDEILPNVTVTENTFNDWQPSAMLKYTMHKATYLRFNYKGKAILPRINYMQNVLDTSSPSNLIMGNPDLEQGYEHKFTVFYNSANTEKSTNLTLVAEARFVSNYVASTVEVMPVDRDTTIYFNGEAYTPQQGAFLRSYANLDGYVYTRSEATYSFRWKAIRSNVNVTGSYGYVRSPSIYTELNYANIHSGGIRLGITSNISEKVDFNVYSNTVLNYTNNSSKENTSFVNQNLYLSNNIIFPKDFVFNSLFSWRYYTSSGVSSMDDSYFTLNAGLGKKILKDRNGEVRVTVYDILNQNRNLQHYVNNNNIQDVRTNTMGRYVLARFMYRFNSLSHGKAARQRKMGGDNYKSINVKDLQSASGN